MAYSEKNIVRLVKRGRWEKIRKILQKSEPDTRIIVTTELGNTSEEEAFNILIILLKDRDEKVQLQAVKSIGNVGVERAKVHLQDMLSKVPQEQTELIDAIKDSIAKINKAAELEAM